MRKVLIFQHVAHEILGTLNPLLKQRGFRIRFINFDRHPSSQPSLDKYNGLIVLGGYMGVYEASRYSHIAIELKLIEAALKKDIPVLGICLGAQMLAHALGADVNRSRDKEIGWYDVYMTAHGARDPLFSHFEATEKLFQMHGDTFEIPRTAQHLAWSTLCQGQAFRYGSKVYGLQFHLEVDQAMIARSLRRLDNFKDLEGCQGNFIADHINCQTEKYISRSMQLSRETFTKFIDTFGPLERPSLVFSGHGQPRKARD
jgi:GMP synthase (glutamine-hydrolysing)